MGLSTKQVADDHGLDWGPTLLQSSTLELPEPPPARRLQRQQPPEQLECPRCGSINTKFCYYNNYNKSQPRHFCKACKRHWTKGGTLRNVPVGGARKNKRLKTSSAATFAAATSTAVIDSNTHMGLESQKQSQSLSLSNSDQRTRSGGLIRPPSSLQQESFSGNNGGFTGSTLSSLPQIQNLNFPFPSLGSVFTDPSSLSSSCQSSNDYNCNGGFKTMEATELGNMVFNSSNNIASQPWQVPITSSVTDMPNYWNWDDLDTFITTDLNVSWDDTEIKP